MRGAFKENERDKNCSKVARQSSINSANIIENYLKLIEIVL